MRTNALLIALVTVTSAACGATAAPPPPRPSPPPPARGPETEQEMLSRINREARAGSVTETLHGVEVIDPYRSLEQDSPGTRAWMDAQTARTQRAFDGWARPGARERLDELLSIGVISDVRIAGDRIFFQKRDGDREQPALYFAEGGQLVSQPLVDPLEHGERAALDWYFPSPDGRHVAFGISQNGDEQSTLHVIAVDDRRVLDDAIAHTKWAGVEWLHGEPAFYYTRYPREGEPNWDDEHEDTYFPRVFFHRLGTDAANDSLVYGSDRGTDFPSMSVSADDRWLVINVFRGWSASDVFLLDRGARPRGRVEVPGEGHSLVPVVAGRDHLTQGRVYRGTLYLQTNEDAPKYRIATVAPAHAADRTAWRDVIPQGDSAIEGWTLVGGRIAVHYIDDVRSRVSLYRLDGRPAGEVELPTPGSVDGLDGQPDGQRLVFSFSSYLYPPSLFSFDVGASELTRIDQVQTDLDLSRFALDRVRVPSADGTEIPVTIVRAADMERDGNRPVLVMGYGGFNVSLLPSFTRNALYWIERGGVYAVPNLRGGGEFGEDWHRAGNLANKVKVFEDFEAVVRWLGTGGISRPERIAITGGSNGGLLVGAALTRFPDAFGAATSYVGLYDMLRFHRFPPAELWVSEYGTAENDEQFAWLHGYSPYHRVVDGVSYPSTLVETADHDSRVYWGHSTKFAARLQEANSSDHPIFFYMVRSVGHGAGTRLSDLVERYVRQYAFLEHELGLEP